MSLGDERPSDMLRSWRHSIASHPREALFGTCTIVGMFLLYWYSGAASPYSRDFAQYPFGADVPPWVFREGTGRLHSLMWWLLGAYQALTEAVRTPYTTLVAKLPYALLGAANVVAAIGAFALLIGQFNARAILYGASCGLTMIVWFYASRPESYMLTTLLYSMYFAIFMRFAVKGSSGLGGVVLSFVFFLGLLNDISMVFVAIVPAVYYGVRLIQDGHLRRTVIYHVVLSGLYALSQIQSIQFIATYRALLKKNSPLFISEPGDIVARIDPLWPALSYFFHALGAPTSQTTYGLNPALPDYLAFFSPSPWAYFSSGSSVLFVFSYLAVLSCIRFRNVSRLVVALFSFVVLRFLLAQAFNPLETLIYSSVSVLPLFLVLFAFVEKLDFRFRTALAGLFATSLLLTNFKFLA